MKYLTLLILLFPLSGHTEDFKLVIIDHHFQPSELKVPSGIKIKLSIENRDNTPEEFDSHALNREKIITGNSAAIIYIGPLAAGRYEFQGEFHSSTAIGTIIAQ